MMGAAPNEIADAYLRYHARKQEADRWAWEKVEDLIEHDLDEAWRIICALVSKASSDEALAYVAAGPLENLLVRHGPAVIDKVEDESRNNSRLQLALSGVWGIGAGNPIFDRWHALMWKYGFAGGKRRAL
jgi:hypothetical protein